MADFGLGGTSRWEKRYTDEQKHRMRVNAELAIYGDRRNQHRWDAFTGWAVPKLSDDPAIRYGWKKPIIVKSGPTNKYNWPKPVRTKPFDFLQIKESNAADRRAWALQDSKNAFEKSQWKKLAPRKPWLWTAADHKAWRERAKGLQAPIVHEPKVWTQFPFPSYSINEKRKKYPKRYFRVSDNSADRLYPGSIWSKYDPNSTDYMDRMINRQVKRNGGIRF